MNADSDILTVSDIPLSKIRILLVDDLRAARRILNLWLESEPNLEIVGSAEDGETALRQVADLRPDIAIVDVEMSDMDGLTLAQIICQRFQKTKVLILSSHDDVHYIKKALAIGVKGYLLKNTPRADLIHAIQFIHKGYLQLGPQLFEKLEAGILPLSPQAPPGAPVPQVEPVPPAIVVQSPQVNPAPLPEVFALPAAEQAWSETTQSSMDTLPQVWAQGLLLLIVLFTAVALPWSMLARIDVMGNAMGRLEPKGQTVRLDAPIAGAVTAIAVREGESVKVGQSLVEFNAQVVLADLQQSEAKLAGLAERLINLQQLERQLQDNIATQQERNRLEASEQLETIAQLNQKIALNQTARTAAQRLFNKDQNLLDRYRNLRQEGVISGIQVDDIERRQIENDQKLKQVESELQQNKTEVDKQQQVYARIVQEGELSVAAAQKQLKELQTQIAEIRSEMNQAQIQVKSLQYQKQQNVLRAPIEGTVFELSIQHPGAVVNPGQAIAKIAPRDAPLVLRAQMPSSQSGFLKVGLPVQIKFDAYPFQDYGIVTGRLTWISPDSRRLNQIPDSSAGGNPVEVFDLEIVLDRNYIQSGNKRVSFTPGQTAKAEILIRQRRVIDFLLDPFKKLQNTDLSS